MKRRSDAPSVIVIPDTQIEPGKPDEHCRWIGQWIVDEFAGDDTLTIVHLGDHAAMQSLSSYERPGSKAMEGARYRADIDAANAAFDKLNAPLDTYNTRRSRAKKATWSPRKVLTLGNHEDRITRYANEHPQLDGAIGLHDLNYADHGWEVVPFLQIVTVHGIAISHYFENPNNGRPIAGTIENTIRAVGGSFIQGHKQGLRVGIAETPLGRRRGIVAGSYYVVGESYRSPQAQDEWRGCLCLFEVRDGDYCLLELSLDYLCRRATGQSVADWVRDWKSERGDRT